MEPNKVINARRIQLGLTEKDISLAAGLSLHEFLDVELHSSEALTVTPLRALKKICEKLNLDLLELIGEKCAFCELTLPYLPCYQSRRNVLIAKRRQELALSVGELADRLGFNDAVVVQMEKEEDFLEEWSIDLIRALSLQLTVPLQVLIAYRCPKCNR